MQVQSCSGQGSLDPLTGLCICAKGWGSRGDFSPIGSDVACDQDLSHIRGLALGTAILAFLILPYKFLFFYLRMHSKSNSNTKWTQGFFVASSICHDMTMIANGILKFISPETYVFGNSASSTAGLGMDILLIANAIFFGILNHSVALNLTAFLDGYSKIMPEALKSVRAFSLFIRNIGIIIPISSSIFSTLPAIAHAVPSLSSKLSHAYLIGFALCGISAGLILLENFRIILREVGTFLSEKQDSPVTNMVRKLYYTAYTQTVILVIRVVLTWTLWIVFIYQPYCRRHFSVLFMAHYLTGYPVVAFGVSAMWNFRKPSDVNGTAARIILSKVITFRPGLSSKYQTGDSSTSMSRDDNFAEYSYHQSTARMKHSQSNSETSSYRGVVPIEESSEEDVPETAATMTNDTSGERKNEVIEKDVELV